MKNIVYVYGFVFVTIHCYCADGPEKSEISPRDQESPRKKFFSGKVDLRKAIANSSPRRTTSRDEIEKSDSLSRESSPRDLESPRTRLKRSQSVHLSSQKDNKTLRDVRALEEGSSPRGENLVLTLLRIKEKQDQKASEAENFRAKSSVPQVDFQHSSPDPKLLILMGESEKSSSDKKHKLISTPKALSAEDQALVEQGVYIKLPLLDDLFSKGESSSSKNETDSEYK